MGAHVVQQAVRNVMTHNVQPNFAASHATSHQSAFTGPAFMTSPSRQPLPPPPPPPFNPILAMRALHASTVNRSQPYTAAGATTHSDQPLPPNNVAMSSTSFAAPPPPQFACSYCGRAYATKATLRNHVTRSHAAAAHASSVRCDFCRKSFEDERKLTQHLSSDCEQMMLKSYLKKKDDAAGDGGKSTTAADDVVVVDPDSTAVIDLE